MSDSANDRIQDLCSKIAVEQDRDKFLKLIVELNQALAARDRQLKDERNRRESD
jgi:hypothetical protein